ncbi:MAG: hypothetical protein ACFFEF_18270 [Candidatus Thorarchaeota archaeon]
MERQFLDLTWFDALFITLIPGGGFLLFAYYRIKGESERSTSAIEFMLFPLLLSLPILFFGPFVGLIVTPCTLLLFYLDTRGRLFMPDVGARPVYD